MIGVNILEQYSSKPTQFLMRFVEREFIYLKLTKHFALQYELNDKNDEIIILFSNLDCGGEKATKISLGVYRNRFGVHVHLEYSHADTHCIVDSQRGVYHHVQRALREQVAEDVHC